MTLDGWEHKTDQKHADLVILEARAGKQSTLTHHRGDKKAMLEEENSEALLEADATRFRAVAAKANYLSGDWPDIQYAVKGISRKMSRPVKGDLQK